MTTVAAKIRVAEVAPSYCSSCFSQKPDELHVDFGAYYDGPVLDGAKAQQIDDLFLCEECLSAAAALVPSITGKLQEQIAALGERIADLQAANSGQARYIESLQAAVADKPEPPKRGARK